MPVYRYQGIDQRGKKTSGVIDADNERGARVKLRRTNVFPTVVSIEGAGVVAAGQREFRFATFLQRIKPQDMALMTRQFASLLGAGVPLVDSLNALVEQMEIPKLRSALTAVRERVTEGEKLSSALQRHPKIFDALFVNMVSAGESSGTLEQVLERLADITEAQARLRSKIVGAMTYPIIMAVVGSLLLVGLITFVIPRLIEMLLEMGVPLPLPTRFLMGLSEFFLTWWWLITLVVGGSVFGFTRWSKTAKGRALIDRKLLGLPLVGRLIRLATVARFSRTLGTLLQGGVPMLAAMDIVRNIVSNTLLKRIVEEAREAVKEGASLHEPLKRSEQFPPLALHMIAIGEKTGELERMLERVADTYEEQVDNTISSLMSLLEPLMLVLMGGMVGFIVVSVMLPMVQASQSMLEQS